MKITVALLLTLAFVAIPVYSGAEDKKESVSITRDRDGWRADYSDNRDTDYHPKGSTSREVREIYTNQGVEIAPSRMSPGATVSQ